MLFHPITTGLKEARLIFEGGGEVFPAATAELEGEKVATTPPMVEEPVSKDNTATPDAEEGEEELRRISSEELEAALERLEEKSQTPLMRGLARKIEAILNVSDPDVMRGIGIYIQELEGKETIGAAEVAALSEADQICINKLKSALNLTKEEQKLFDESLKEFGSIIKSEKSETTPEEDYLLSEVPNPRRDQIVKALEKLCTLDRSTNEKSYNQLEARLMMNGVKLPENLTELTPPFEDKVSMYGANSGEGFVMVFMGWLQYFGSFSLTDAAPTNAKEKKVKDPKDMNSTELVDHIEKQREISTKQLPEEIRVMQSNLDADLTTAAELLHGGSSDPELQKQIEEKQDNLEKKSKELTDLKKQIVKLDLLLTSKRADEAAAIAEKAEKEKKEAAA